MYKSMPPHSNYNYIGNVTIDNFKINNVSFNYDTYDDLENYLILKSDECSKK